MRVDDSVSCLDLTACLQIQQTDSVTLFHAFNSLKREQHSNIIQDAYAQYTLWCFVICLKDKTHKDSIGTIALCCSPCGFNFLKAKNKNKTLNTTVISREHSWLTDSPSPHVRFPRLRKTQSDSSKQISVLFHTYRQNLTKLKQTTTYTKIYSGNYQGGTVFILSHKLSELNCLLLLWNILPPRLYPIITHLSSFSSIQW